MDDRTDLSDLVVALNGSGYSDFKRMPDGSWCCIASMVYTTALMFGVTKAGYRRRYCYEHRRDAIDALTSWDGTGDPAGPWIKEKPGERLGPGATR